MTALKDISMPRQSRLIYELLLKEGQLSAKQIGHKLGIYPNAAYRSLENLKNLGCVVITTSRPATYKAISPLESVERFALLSREGFLSAFATSNHGTDEELEISFIKDRNSLLKKYECDIKHVKYQVNLIVSGHQLPKSVYYANLRSIKQGVKIRAIIQNYSSENKREISYWRDIGIKVKYAKDLRLRLVTFDDRITHIMSYSAREKMSGLGVRISYPPITKMMQDVFEKNWEQADDLKLSHM